MNNKNNEYDIYDVGFDRHLRRGDDLPLANMQNVFPVKERSIGETNIEDGKKLKTQMSKPYTFIKDGVGYFKFYKEGDNIKIGGGKTRHFRFLQCLCIPHFGIKKIIEAVFEAIKIDKDLRNSILTGFESPQNKTRILTTIKNSCIKELQKNEKLKKIKYKIDNYEKRAWLELEG